MTSLRQDLLSRLEKLEAQQKACECKLFGCACGAATMAAAAWPRMLARARAEIEQHKIRTYNDPDDVMHGDYCMGCVKWLDSDFCSVLAGWARDLPEVK